MESLRAGPAPEQKAALAPKYPLRCLLALGLNPKGLRGRTGWGGEESDIEHPLACLQHLRHTLHTTHQTNPSDHQLPIASLLLSHTHTPLPVPTPSSPTTSSSQPKSMNFHVCSFPPPHPGLRGRVIRRPHRTSALVRPSGSSSRRRQYVQGEQRLTFRVSGTHTSVPRLCDWQPGAGRPPGKITKTQVGRSTG